MFTIPISTCKKISLNIFISRVISKSKIMEISIFDGFFNFTRKLKIFQEIFFKKFKQKNMTETHAKNHVLTPSSYRGHVFGLNCSEHYSTKFLLFLALGIRAYGQFLIYLALSLRSVSPIPGTQPTVSFSYSRHLACGQFLVFLALSVLSVSPRGRIAVGFQDIISKLVQFHLNILKYLWPLRIRFRFQRNFPVND